MATAGAASSLKRWAAWIFFFGYSGIVVSGAVAPPSAIPHFLLKANDKIVHGIEFFFLYWAAWNAFQNVSGNFLSRYAWMLAWGYTIFMGAFTEWLQMFAPLRACDFHDFTADLIGSGAAAMLVLWGKKRI